MSEEDKYVIHGPESDVPLPNSSLGREIFEKLLANMGTDDAMVDVFTGRTLSYKSLLQKSCELAEVLRCYGCTTGTVVSISSENSLEFFIPVLASIFVGCIVAPINHTYMPNEVIHNLNIGEPKLIFCSKSASSKFLDLKKSPKYMEEIIIIDSNELVPGTQNLENFVKKYLNGRSVSIHNFQPIDGDPSKLGAFILCSSGTTGLPKGVLLSHKNILFRFLQSRDRRYTLSGTNILGLMPFFHSYGLNVCLSSFVEGRKIIVLRRFEEDAFLKAIQDYKISLLALAPPLAVFMEKSPKVSNYDLSSIEEIICGAAPLSKNTELALKNRLKNLKMFRQGYGLTESTLAVTIMDNNDEKPGSCGKVTPFLSCKVRDPETGKALGPNQIGELCFKGPLIMMGYYKDERATKETFTSDGWLKTGDLGYYDDEKYFYIVDRLKELIKYKGYQVAPAELEALLLNHPKIRDVGVVGFPDELAGELPLAFVVKNEGQDVTEAELKEYVRAYEREIDNGSNLHCVKFLGGYLDSKLLWEQHAHYIYKEIPTYMYLLRNLVGMVSSQKWLRGGVIFVSDIPKNPSGKILRRELRERLKNYKKISKSKL